MLESWWSQRAERSPGIGSSESKHGVVLLTGSRSAAAWELPSQLEEYAYRWRNGRLADYKVRPVDSWT